MYHCRHREVQVSQVCEKIDPRHHRELRHQRTLACLILSSSPVKIGGIVPSKNHIVGGSMPIEITSSVLSPVTSPDNSLSS